MNELPKVISKDILNKFDELANSCEICNLKMKEHDWVVIDINGFAIFCSNLIFVSAEQPVVIQQDYYEGELKPDSFSYGETNRVDRLMALAIRSATVDFECDEGPERIEVYARSNFTFAGPKIRSQKFGDWENK